MALPSPRRLLAAIGPLLGLVASQDTLGLANGYIDIDTPSISARIVKDAQVLASLRVAGHDFDFLPFDYLDRRARNGQYHWGDITLRYRAEGSSAWVSADSAAQRKPVAAGSASGDVLAFAALAATLPAGPLNITREWLAVDEDLGLRFTVENTGSSPVEIGSLGFPAEFNSIFTNREAVAMQEKCSLSDPYVGLDAGHIRVTPVNPRRGSAAALVVTPLKGTNSGLEAYRNLREPSFEDTWYGSQTFEGFYEWQVLTKAWAENEWAVAKDAEGPWNEPTSRTLAPGESVQVGVRFTVVEDGTRGFDAAIRKTGTPTAVSVPGYILTSDLPGKLFLHSESAVASFSSHPDGALNVKEAGDSYTVTPSSSHWGRARLTVKYADGRVQTVHYFITKPTSQALGDMGTFLFNDAWFTDESDPFNRTPSVMTYDYERRAIVEQDARAWVAGLSDEGGTGAYVAAAVKQVLQPDANEVAKLDQFVNEVVWGHIQLPDYSVRKSIFFYEPALVDYEYDSNIDWRSWTSWNRQNSYYIDRAYNYVHPAAAYWSLYRVARAYPDLVGRGWAWYLERAYGTAYRMTDSEIWYNDMGLMGETVFGSILQDLFREGETEKASKLEVRMKARAEHWNAQEVPYGSEMAWDSTGQEGVYYWTKYFGLNDAAAQTVDSVLGYMPTVPHWGWNGNARRYWDFVYGGKLRRIERQIHHYGSGLNAQVLLGAFREDPSDSYLLRVGYAGSAAPVSNINRDGFPSAAYHSWPDTLKWDGITGDYGGGFLGMALGGGTYVADDAELGLVAYGGVLETEGGKVTVRPRDAVKRRVFVGPLRLLVEIDAGVVEEFRYEEACGALVLKIGQHEGGPVAKAVVVWVDSRSDDKWEVVHEGATEARGGWKVEVGEESAEVRLRRS
ncbi:hypothetical protein B0T11DRAFT_217470 [Plectosphaerella cucumerina]|uniref:Glycoside hydrolase family 43 protein n=1 Tax=Plectosphaerella cucumerina TaxID=40658 RepID=A0A8K0TSU8_9PEZI|nr:hypothetical protein B0T11DRAFT_217470 [Plectosphaerella cucumerina]